MNILIVGYGFVGKATEYLFRHADVKVEIDDPKYDFKPTSEEFDYIFLCLPTPEVAGKLDTDLLKDCYERWMPYGKIVIRSTIGPDQIEDFPDSIMMPEFLRERHWQEDVDDITLPIIVGDPEFAEVCKQLLPHKKVYYVRNSEAMMYKLARNTALAMRVAIANEFKEICDAYFLNYDLVQSLLENDLVVGGTHWKVPGPDGMLGFGGTCLPKDLTHMSSLCYNQINIFRDAMITNLERRYPKSDEFYSNVPVDDDGEDNELN
jgi:UDP-glucose 6-dehydrogenase